MQAQQQVISQIPELPRYEAFYYGALKYGPQGKQAQTMADPTDFQGRAARAKEAMELALEGNADENMTEDAVQRIIDLAQEDQGATVDELMQIIEGRSNG
jgi:hypothetical protein